MSKIKRAIVLAAGKGTRLGELTQKTPKPLIDLGGVTPLERVVKSLEQAGIEEVVINCAYLADQIIDKVTQWKSENKFKCNLIISRENEPLETAGGIKHAIHHFKNEPFVVTNADIVWEGDFTGFVKELIEKYDDEEMDFLMGMTPSKYSPKKLGSFKFTEDNHIDFLSKSEKSDNTHACVSVAHPRAFEGLEEGFSFLRVVWDKAILVKRYYGFKKDCAWIDMGTPDELERAKNMVLNES